MQNSIKRGDIFLVNLNMQRKKEKEETEPRSEQKGYRPMQ